MPKHFSGAMTKMEYHPIIIRFTSHQISELKNISEKRKGSKTFPKSARSLSVLS